MRKLTTMFSLVLLLALGLFSFNASGGACAKHSKNPNFGYCNKHKEKHGDITITTLKCDDRMILEENVRYEHDRCYNIPQFL